MFKRIFIPFSILISAVLSLSAQQNFMHESKEEKDKRMEWWRQARFGMFIHWGLYAVPAGEWKGTTNHAEWIRTTAQIPLEEYNKFVGQFNPVKFNAEEWVQMAKNAGMKYITITSKHHDGFCLWNSKETDFDVMSTPFKRDILKELADACRRIGGVKLCFYHSIMDWHHPDYNERREWEKDRPTEGTDRKRYIAYMKNELKELVTNYGDIGVIWFDGEWEGFWTHEDGKDLYNYVRSLKADIIINNRVDKGRSGMAGMTTEGDYAGDFGTPEQEIPETGLPGLDWENVVKTVGEFNDAVNDAPFDPSKHDGKCAQGISPVKSNWAQRLDTPPYYAFPVTCGITFTFGGVGISESGEVKDTSGNVISGLFAAGEITGGSFFNNYPGGSGLMKGAVFGRLAGTSAAAFAKAKRA